MLKIWAFAMAAIICYGALAGCVVGVIYSLVFNSLAEVFCYALGMIAMYYLHKAVVDTKRTFLWEEATGCYLQRLAEGNKVPEWADKILKEK